MFTGAKKIQKPAGDAPTDFEQRVAQELWNLEMSAVEIKSELRDLYITSAQEVPVGPVSAGKKAIIIFVPFRLLKQFHKIHVRLVRELEKKFSGSHVVILAQRKILGKNFARSSKQKGPRPRSRTLTTVQDAILEDLVYPTEIVGKRTRCKVDGTMELKVFLEWKEKVNVDTKLETFSDVYKRLTHKDVVFEFPVEEA
eukprot:CAMPEP_0118973660 /NCGR_PEP_ID=MMETSP1173-20130426/10670_1 /TAXON_ID=1034831 /ORGANISM="Rhizochromulina marina cf, Strain CCMP1243" /LENGTH=197 /DNA_ID=CAMNT_0006923347 /DNA_START=52 /DNA_END=645 /DNA_ORIENTATION=+